MFLKSNLLFNSFYCLFYFERNAYLCRSYHVCYYVICITIPANDLMITWWKVIRRYKAEGRISKRVFQENKARQIFHKTNIWNERKKCSFFGKFGMLCFLETPVLRFALLPYYRPILVYHTKNKNGNRWLRNRKQYLWETFRSPFWQQVELWLSHISKAGMH